MNEVLRQEKKYAINLVDSIVLRGRLDSVMHGDAHNGAQGYTIRSLYFDTLDDEDFSNKIDGLELRRKIQMCIRDSATGDAAGGEKETLVMATEATFPPYEYYDCLLYTSLPALFGWNLPGRFGRPHLW